MLPYANLIPIQKDAATPVYLQVCNGFIRLIKDGVLQRNSRLPGTRQLSETLQLHRKTIVAAYEELLLQGWVIARSSQGTYVSDTIPEIQPKAYHTRTRKKKTTGFALAELPVLHTQVYKKTKLLELNDGLPDIRIAPMDSLARAMRSVIKGERGQASLSYNDIEGHPDLRKELSAHLNESRGFDYGIENVFITRGAIMGLYLSLSVLLKKGDHVIVAEFGYRSVNMIIEHLGANLIKIPVDKNGLVIEEIEKLCKRKKIRAIYVTPHHHYPTTVTMPPERRIKLLALAEKYGIALLEDDYDYDYHFRHSPYLPLASSDPAGVVIYIGSLSKTFSPAFRVGYIVAPENFIQEVAKLRRVIDRQGDTILEQAIAEMFKLGEMKNHLRKSHQVYKERRDFFCERLKEVVGNKIQFDVPEGGLALWARFDNKISLTTLTKEAASNGLLIQDSSSFGGGNATRLGYASHTLEELDKSILLLNKSMDRISRK